MQLHKKIFIVALVLSICISLYFLINQYNILNFPIFVSEFDDTTFKYYMFVKIGIVLLFIKFLLDICLEYIKNWFKNFWQLFKQRRLGQKSYPLNCLWIVDQDAVFEWALLRWFHQLLQPYSTVRRWDDEIEF